MAAAAEPAPAAPEPEAAAALVEVSQLPDEEPAGEEPTPPVDPTPDRDETDPEEFEEEFDDPEPAPPAEGDDLPRAPTVVPTAASLPQTGSDVAPLAAIGMSLLLVGGSLRRVRPARR
jgi:LPXTG-motif cell wall-anchored protein